MTLHPSAAPSPSRRGFAALLIGALSATSMVLAACGGGSSGGDDKPVLRVGDQKGGVRAVLEAAGELKDVPYKIEWAEMPAAAPLLEALSAGALDVGSTGAAPFAFAYGNGAQIRAIMVTRVVERGPEAGRGTAILVPANSPLKTIHDLRGKKLATVKGSIGQDVALRLLDAAHIDFKDVQFVYLTNGEAKAALSSGSIDAWATWNPYTGIAVVENGDRVLQDARDLPTSGGGYWSASVKALETKKPLLRDFVQRYVRARQWALAHPDELAQQRSKETGVPVAAIRYGGAAGSVSELAVVDSSVLLEQKATFERYRRAGVIDKIPDLKEGGYDSSFNDLFVKPAAPTEPAKPAG